MSKYVKYLLINECLISIERLTFSHFPKMPLVSPAIFRTAVQQQVCIILSVTYLKLFTLLLPMNSHYQHYINATPTIKRGAGPLVYGSFCACHYVLCDILMVFDNKSNMNIHYVVVVFQRVAPGK